MKKKAGFYQQGKDYAMTPKEVENLGPRLRKVVDIFSHRKFGRILDVGCGDGNFSMLLKEVSQASEVYGIEISKEGVELASKAGVKVFCLNIDSAAFPFEDEYFDAIFAGEVIEHLNNPDHLLEEIHRTLKPKGLLVLSTPNLASWFNRIALLFGFQPYGTNPSLKFVIGHLKDLQNSGMMVTADHIRVFTLRAAKKLLEMHNCGIIKVMGTHDNVPCQVPLSPLLNIVDRVLSLSPCLSYRLVIACRKKESEGLTSVLPVQ